MKRTNDTRIGFMIAAVIILCITLTLIHVHSIHKNNGLNPNEVKYEYEDTGFSKSALEDIKQEAKRKLLAEQFFWDLTKEEAAPFIGSNQPDYKCFVDAVRGTVYIRYQSGAGNYREAGISPIFFPNGTCAYYLEDIENVSSFKKALDERVSKKINAR